MADATPRHATRGGKPTLLVSRVILFRPSYLGEKESWSISPGISRRSRQLAPSHFPLSHMILPKMSLFHHSFFVLPSFLPSVSRFSTVALGTMALWPFRFTHDERGRRNVIKLRPRVSSSSLRARSRTLVLFEFLDIILEKKDCSIL